jgi:4-hydroxy-tetrahydrodipicolinate synthase
MKFEGIYPPVITPYNEDYSINFENFREIIESLLAAGVDGLIIGGTTGEYYVQTVEERNKSIRIAKSVIADQVPMIVGVGGIRTEDCIHLGQIAKDNGADAILMNAPYYAVPTQSELAAHALAIDRAVNLPIMLYNYPVRTGTIMQREFFDRISESSNFAAIKESTGSIAQLHMLALDYPNLTLLCGMDDQALEFFAWGAKGWVCAGGNCLPREHIALYQAVACENNLGRGRKIMTAMMPFLHILEQGGKLIQAVKHACALKGLPAGTVRRPLQPLSLQEEKEIESVLATLEAELSAAVDTQ